MPTYETLYKRNQNGGFVFWKVEYVNGGNHTRTEWGAIGSSGSITTKAFGSSHSAEIATSKIRNGKISEGLYHTFSQLGIQTDDVDKNIFNWDNGHKSGWLFEALDRTLPLLNGAAIPKVKPVKQKPIEDHLKANPNVKITIHLPRL